MHFHEATFRRLTYQPTGTAARTPALGASNGVPAIFHSMSRRAPAFRSLAAAALVGFTWAGSGLPMCLSLVQQAGQSCPMHGQLQHGSGTDVWQPVVVSHAPANHSCHPGNLGLGCTAVDACPSAGAAAPAWAAVVIAIGGTARESGWAQPVELLSFLAPPLSPPPQA